MKCSEQPVISTLSLVQASRTEWDVLVVGAGPAGAVAARQLACLGLQVLLVDKSAFPRWKVCGCCLNGAALDVLAQIGIGSDFFANEANPLTAWQIETSHGQVRCRLPRGYAISRTRLDSYLVSEAVDAGSDLLTETSAKLIKLDQVWSVQLSQGAQQATLSARIVVAADGLAGRLLDDVPGFAPQVSSKARIGAATTVQVDHSRLDSHTIYMACDRHGYVGMVHLDSSRIEVAAALDVPYVRQEGSLVSAVDRLLASCGVTLPFSLDQVKFQGTPPLTRSRKTVAGPRLFAVGDACGYTEPFTGEGMSWAISTGAAVAPLVWRGCQDWRDEWRHQWIQVHSHLVRSRHRSSRFLMRAFRSPAVMRLIVRLLQRAPSLANFWIDSFDRARPIDHLPENAAGSVLTRKGKS